MIHHHVTWHSFAAAPYMTHALCVVSSACSFSIVPWTLFRPWILYRPWTPWCTPLEKLHHVTWRSFAAAPYMTHALRVASSARSFSLVPWTLYRPWTLWSTHFRILHHVTWRSFAAAPYVTHALRVASSARSFSIVPRTLFQPWILYRPWTPWLTH